MSSGRASALDIRWGRGGGRRKAPGHPAGLVAELDEIRRAIEAQPKVDPPCNQIGCLLKVSEHLPVCRICGNWVEHHEPGVEELEWELLARAAMARRPADRTILDIEALDRFPHPRSWIDTPTPEGLRAALERYRLRHLEAIPA